MSSKEVIPVADFEAWKTTITDIHWTLVHDLRAPVAAAYSSATMLQEDDLDDESRRQLLQVMVDSLKNALKLIDHATNNFEEVIKPK